MAKDIPHTISRFVDTEFDNKKLSPVCGYWNEKLVSIEQALKPIERHIDQLKRSIKAAKKYCHFPSEHGLTHDESAALYLYTMEGGDNSFYRVLNQALRSEDRPALKPWFPYLKLLDTAFAKLPTVRKNIWRGVTGDIGMSLKKGEDLIWWSVTSCSLSIDVIKGFLAFETASTLFLIEAINGKCISGYTNYPNEDEVLLAPGTELRVVADVLSLPGGVSIVHLVEMSEEHLTLPVAEMCQSLQASNRETLRTDQPGVASMSIPMAKSTKKKSFSSESTIGRTQESQQRQKSNLQCGGRRCRECGRCRSAYSFSIST